MAMIQPFYHECALTSSESVTYGICNLCYEDKPVRLSCRVCNFDLCEFCSKLPPEVSHDFHPKHPLVFCLREDNRKPRYVVCSGCGNMCPDSFYECKECEVYLDLECAVQANIFRGWDVKEKLDESHLHLLRRCKPGPDARGSCLLCESPICPSAICYGCVYCYMFVHERCFGLPREIQHPVHPAHPLKRLSYLRIWGGQTSCDACKLLFNSTVPFGCLECNVKFHLRCADSLLRGLMHKSHEHRLSYVNSLVDFGLNRKYCQICSERIKSFTKPFYKCVECKLIFHFECLKIPKSIVKKIYHIHPLVCKVFTAKADPLEYCGVCETMVVANHHVYSCEECDYLGHIECILREEVPSPLYLKDLYSGNESIKKSTCREDGEANEVENKLLVDDVNHVHVMRPADDNLFDNRVVCVICNGRILRNPFKCENCSFLAHELCANMGKISFYKGLHREHPDHPLTLLRGFFQSHPMNCDTCRKAIKEFFLFCRMCDISIHINCVLRDKHFHGASQQGQKVIEVTGDRCMNDNHPLFKVLVLRSYQHACSICDETLDREVISCMECGNINHPLCAEGEMIWCHPLHPTHRLQIHITSGSMCLSCKMNITKYGFHCDFCKVSFHIKCIKAVDISSNPSQNCLDHYLYNFWMDTSGVTQACTVCGRPCAASFYGCICCNFRAHVGCLGFPYYVKNQLHQHTLLATCGQDQVHCSLCGLKNESTNYYSCKHCTDCFHLECIISMDDREAATEEEQLIDIYLMYLERHIAYFVDEETLIENARVQT